MYYNGRYIVIKCNYCEISKYIRNNIYIYYIKQENNQYIIYCLPESTQLRNILKEKTYISFIKYKNIHKN